MTAAADANVEIRNGAVYAGAYGIDASAAPGGPRISDIRVYFAAAGIRAGAGATIEDCTVYRNGDRGITVTSGVVRRCTVFGNQRNGIEAKGNSLIEDNLVFDNGIASAEFWAQIAVTGSMNRIQDNVVLPPSGGAPSFRLSASQNLILRNMFKCAEGIVDTGGNNYYPGALDLVDTNYCY